MSDLALTALLLDLRPLAGYRCLACMKGVHHICDGQPCQCRCDGWLHTDSVVPS